MTATPAPRPSERHPQYPRAVLAYGTLRPEGANWAHTVGDLPQSHLNVWLEGWGLYFTHRGFPYAVPDPGAHLIGTVLEFDTSTWPTALDRCDWLEGYPLHYTRSVVTAHYPKPGGAQIRAWIYHPAGGLADLGPRARRIMSGDWFAADSPRRTPESIAAPAARQTGAGR